MSIGEQRDLHVLLCLKVFLKVVTHSVVTG